MRCGAREGAKPGGGATLSHDDKVGGASAW